LPGPRGGVHPRAQPLDANHHSRRKKRKGQRGNHGHQRSEGAPLKYDSATKTLQPQGDNPQVYISINYSFGDVVSDENTFKAVSLDRLQLKALFLAGKRPLDSVGLGVGYQLPRIDAVDLSALSIFAGRFWTKQDAVSAQGAPQTNVSTAHDWRVGITYDVAQGLKWIKTN